MQRLRGKAYCSSDLNEDGEFPERLPRLLGPDAIPNDALEFALAACSLEDRQRIFSSFRETMV